MASPASHLFPDGQHCLVHKELTTSKVFREGRINQTKITLERGWNMQPLKKSVQQQQKIHTICLEKKPGTLSYKSNQPVQHQQGTDTGTEKAQPQEVGGDASTTSFQVKEWGEDRSVLYCQPTNWHTNSLHQDAGSGCLDLGHGKKQNSLCFHILYHSMAAGGCCCWRDSAVPPCVRLLIWQAGK